METNLNMKLEDLFDVFDFVFVLDARARPTKRSTNNHLNFRKTLLIVFGMFDQMSKFQDSSASRNTLHCTHGGDAVARLM